MVYLVFTERTCKTVPNSKLVAHPLFCNQSQNAPVNAGLSELNQI